MSAAPQKKKKKKRKKIRERKRKEKRRESHGKERGLVSLAGSDQWPGEDRRHDLSLVSAGSFWMTHRQRRDLSAQVENGGRNGDWRTNLSLPTLDGGLGVNTSDVSFPSATTPTLARWQERQLPVIGEQTGVASFQ